MSCDIRKDIFVPHFVRHDVPLALQSGIMYILLLFVARYIKSTLTRAYWRTTRARPRRNLRFLLADVDIGVRFYCLIAPLPQRLQ